MLAGIIISVVVIAGLAAGLHWLTVHRDDRDSLDEDPTERFSDSMRILRRDVIDYQESADAAEVSTPLMRRAELTELRLMSRNAARRRVRIASLLLVAALGLAGAAALGHLPWWTAAVPAVLLLAFLIVARLGVRSMRRAFDARAARVRGGFGEEHTETIRLGAGDEPSLEIHVDLSAPAQTGPLWDPIPVTAPTYVSKPLVPRTVRTIDLSAPVVAAQPLVPTADRPGSDVEELELEDTERFELTDSPAVVHQFPRAVGE